MRVNSDYLITGSAAEALEEYKKVYSFDYIDSFILSGTLGFVHSSKALKPQKGDKIITIPRSVLIRRKDKIEFLIQLISLIEYSDFDQNELMHIVFGDDDESIDKRVALFEEYFFGGLEHLRALLAKDNFKNEIDNMWESIENLA